ncbi:hypothetical protein UPYG_G00164260 [Umbra pygmaea]|uniref:CUB domain-containing protein n=1 Tax=Umbra pygmaea TaxID=75934 RepID=A0ABD0WM82_UMBPY
MMDRVGAPELLLIKWMCVRFALDCVAACSGKVELHTERRGVIYSPSWPLNYPPGVNCSWNIQGDRGEVITVSFRNFDLEDSGRCQGDWLILSPTWRDEYRVCGSLLPPPFISSRGRVYIFFHSQINSSGLAQGFRMSYIRGRLGQSSCQLDEFLCGNGKCLPRAWRCNGLDECGDATDERSCAPPPTPHRSSLCSPGNIPCTQAQSTLCLPAVMRCNGAPDCPDGSDEAGCPDMACGKRLGNFYGAFASPDFFRPNRSAVGMLRCSWWLDTQDPKPLVLQLDLGLGPGDSLHVYDGLVQRADHLLQALSHHNNRRPALLESSRGQMSLLYQAQPQSTGHGFNATYQVKGYCFPGEHPCGGDQGCYSERQRCDGYWHCPTGRDEEECPACQEGEYPCEGGSGICYPASERCNNQKKCPDGSDEKNCFDCQPGNFHCGTNLCIFETWRCDGQEDCLDGSDERDCMAALPRKVITAALIGSLVCGLLLVIALGCAFKLYSLRTREYRAFETQMTRLEAEFVQREAPPSYGQLIAQGLIPPVEDFPVYNPTQASMLQNIRTAMRRQIRRHSRWATSRRRLGRLWSRLSHRGTRFRGQTPLLTPPGAQPGQVTLNLHSYHTAERPGGVAPAQTPSPCSTAQQALSPHPSESPPSPLSPSDSEHSVASQSSPESQGCRVSSPPSALSTPGPQDGATPPDPSSLPQHCPSEDNRGHYTRRSSRKLVLGLAANLRGVALQRYSPLGLTSPVVLPTAPHDTQSPLVHPLTSPQTTSLWRGRGGSTPRLTESPAGLLLQTD